MIEIHLNTLLMNVTLVFYLFSVTLTSECFTVFSFHTEVRGFGQQVETLLS